MLVLTLQGTSDYQAAWLLDDEYGDVEDDNDDEDDEDGDAAMGSRGGDGSDEDPPELGDLIDDDDGTGEAMFCLVVKWEGLSFELFIIQNRIIERLHGYWTQVSCLPSHETCLPNVYYCQALSWPWMRTMLRRTRLFIASFESSTRCSDSRSKRSTLTRSMCRPTSQPASDFRNIGALDSLQI